MNIDVSEVKCFRDCGRKWAFSSRNNWNLKSRAPQPALAFGTLFHEALASLYLKGDPQRVLELTLRELTDPSELRTMESMIRGYVKDVLPTDLEKYHVLDVEHHFKMDIEPFKSIGVTLCGSIDMIVVDTDNTVWGFEHKTCGRFRDPLYTAVDEQPRLYTIALKQYIEKLDKGYTFGGIYLNEVRKVQRTFDYKRTLCKYSDEDLQNFLNGFYVSCAEIYKKSRAAEVPQPSPGMMKCQCCDFHELCTEYSYATPQIEDVLDEYSEELEVRKVDHLEEKLERHGEAGSPS